MEAQGSPGIKASQLLMKMNSRYPGHDHGTPGPPSRTAGDTVPSKAFLCLELPVKSKEWAAEEGSYGSTEGLRVRKSTGRPPSLTQQGAAAETTCCHCGRTPRTNFSELCANGSRCCSATFWPKFCCPTLGGSPSKQI